MNNGAYRTEVLRIYDVANLSEDEVRARVRATIRRHPTLQRIYSDAKVADLVRRRHSSTNYLLFWLVHPVDDERSLAFWSSITDDLTILEERDSFGAFREKMQLEEKEPLSSWRTELWFAAWLARYGVRVTFEPPVGNKHPEFVTDTTPPTWWEVKSPLELEQQRAEQAVVNEVRRRLREIPEPFVLSLVSSDLSLREVPGAVKSIRSQLRAFAQANGKPPARFASAGLIVEASSRTKHRSTGFLGTTSFGYVFGNEHAEQLGDKIASAVPQLPKEGGGVVVIDRTLSDWNDEEDAIDACFGPPVILQKPGGYDFQSARTGGFFRPGGATRVSAVVSYSRHPMHWEYGYELLFIHNPFAKVQLPEDLFRFASVRHLRLVDHPDGDGSFRLVISGDGIADEQI